MGIQKMSESDYAYYYKTVLRSCLYLTRGNQYDAEDLTGEVFHLFFIMQDRLDFESPDALTAWLGKTARNVWRKTVRHAVRKPSDMDETDLFANQFDGVDEEKRYQEYVERVEQTLSGSDLELFRSIVVDRLPYPKVAERFGISEQNLRVRWVRLRKKMRPMVDKMLSC